MKRNQDQQRASSDLSSMSDTNNETASSEQLLEKKRNHSHVQHKIGSTALNAIIAKVKSRRDNKYFEKSQMIGGTEYHFFLLVLSIHKVSLPVEEVQKIMALLDASPTFSSAVTDRGKKADMSCQWMEIETPPHTSIAFDRSFQYNFDKEDRKKKESRGCTRNTKFLIGMNGH